jgi:hypothetical protein
MGKGLTEYLAECTILDRFNGFVERERRREGCQQKKLMEWESARLCVWSERWMPKEKKQRGRSNRIERIDGIPS